MFAQKEVEIGGKKLLIETGRFAKQANGSVMVRYGDTMVLVTAVAAEEAKEDMGFFPLQVEYREKTSAAGKFPGGFIKREGRPTEKEILSSRLIDRPIRPLFPKEFKKENFDSIVSISEPVESPYWMFSLKKDQLIPLLKINKKHHRRQDLPKIYQLNGAVYVTSRNRIMKKNTILGDKMGGYVMPAERSLDIDNKFEFKIANLLMKSKK